jgi:replicative DNA helicase
MSDMRTESAIVEQNVLGAILFAGGRGDAVDNAFEILKGTDFCSLPHRKIFSAMLHLRSKGVYPDLMSIMTLPEDPDFSFSYCAELYKNTVSAINLRHFTETLKTYSTIFLYERRMREIQDVLQSTSDVSTKKEAIESMFSAEIGFSVSDGGCKTFKEALLSHLDDIERRWETPDQVWHTTGINDLDAILGGGFEVGLYAIGANPKMGKSELLAKMAAHVGFEKQRPVYIGSLEMIDRQVVQRLLSTFGKFDKRDINKGFRGFDGLDPNWDDKQQDYLQFAGGLANSPMYIDDRATIGPRQIRKECMKIVKKHGSIGMVFVDYLQLMKSDSRFERRDLEVGSMTRDLKTLSKELDCPVVMLLQLNRGNTARTDKRPLPSDSRDSGAIEQDVDGWIGLYRESAFDESSPLKGLTEIIVRSNRHGGTGTCYQELTPRGFVDMYPDDVARRMHDNDASQTTQKKYKKSTDDI